MKSSEPVLQADRLTFRYRQFQLGPLTVTCHPGDRIAVIGANGSGKTTLLSILALLKQPHTGTLHLHLDKSKIALLSDQIAFPSHWTLHNCLVAYLNMKQSPHAAEVEPLWKKVTFAEASKGMKMQVLLKAVAIQKPELLICDEPSSGLDPEHQQELLRYLQGYCGTLIMSTHYFSEMQRLPWHSTWLLSKGTFEQRPCPATPDEWSALFHLS